MSKPVLLTVDDDPEVSRAIARDLRRRYGEANRVVRAESGPDGLEALGAFVARGDKVALLLADHRMPGMTGVEFLEQAMDLAPRARRVLLTAYADTDAAIRAINEVDLDRYLLKPWTPPDERLYPALDELLEEWAATDRPAFEGIRLLGDRWSEHAHDLRDLLARNGVPYRWLDVEGTEGAQLLRTARVDPDRLPVLIDPDGQVLVQPDARTVAAAVGLSTEATQASYDVVVVGGGPAGLGSAVYAASEGLRTLLVEQRATGGQAGTSSRIENYLGFPRGVSGDELARHARDQAVKFGTEILTVTAATGIAAQGDLRVVHLEGGGHVMARAVVIATGASYRTLPVPGMADLTGRGVFYGAAGHEAEGTAGQHVVIVGGANSAGQAALNFARHAARVTMLVRAGSLAKSMSHYLIQQIAQVPTIEVRTRTEVVAAEGEGRLQRLRLRTPDGEETVEASHLFVFIGAVPCTDWLGPAFTVDRRGFLCTGPDLLDADGRPPADWPLERLPYHLETSVPGVFAAGDVRGGSVKRVASAVGEGAMAVTLVHRYLVEG